MKPTLSEHLSMLFIISVISKQYRECVKTPLKYDLSAIIFTEKYAFYRIMAAFNTFQEYKCQGRGCAEDINWKTT